MSVGRVSRGVDFHERSTMMDFFFLPSPFFCLLFFSPFISPFLFFRTSYKKSTLGVSIQR